MLDRDKLQKLRNQITLNSLYTHDYENNMGIEAKVCHAFFDGYMSYLNELEKENGENLDFDEFFEKYDTIDNLENWYNCFDTDPLSHFIEALRERIEGRDYTVKDYDTEYYFGKHSSMGQDFGFYIKKEGTVEEFIDRIYDYYNDYDVSEAAYLWLDDSGHGKNGAPYDMKDVYEDMEECEGFILDLYELLKEATK